MQGHDAKPARWTRTAAADSSASDGPRHCSTTRPRRSSARLSSAPTRSCSAGGPTRSSPAPGGAGMDPGNPVGEALNTRPKYVASTTLTDPRWADTTVLSGDVAAAVGELKAKPGGELQVHGSGDLVRWLLDNQLVDEIILLVGPVVLGQGTRLFPATGPDIALDLVESRSTPKGVAIQVYRPTGRPQYETATPD